MDIPADMLDMASEWRDKMIEAAAEADDALIEKFLEGEAITADEIKVRSARERLPARIIPMLCGSAFKNKGVQPMLDAVDRIPAVADRCGRGSRTRPGQRGDRESREPSGLTNRSLRSRSN